jgi:hypothetical protein
VGFAGTVVPATGITAELPQPLIPFSAYDDAFPTVPGAGGLGTGFRGVVVDSGSVRRSGSSDGMTPDWHTGQNATGLSANGSIPLRRPAPTAAMPGLGRNAPGLVLAFGSAAQTYFEGAGTIASVSGTYTYAYGPRTPYQGLTHFCEFEDDPPDARDDATAVVTRLAQYLASPSTPYIMGIGSNGQTIQADACNYAAVGPNCAVYVEASDFGGAGSDLIPGAVTANSASIYRFHPSVFIRNSVHVSSVSRRYHDPFDVVQQQIGTPIRIDVLPATAPRSSDWLLVFDGVAMVVTLLHVDNVTARRPRDLWNQFLVPLFLGPQAVSEAPLLESVFVPGVADTMAPSIMQLRLSHLEYARYLGPVGTPTPQTGSTPA